MCWHIFRFDTAFNRCTRDGNTDTHTYTGIYATVMFTSHAKIADIFCDVKSNDISNNEQYAQRAHTIRYLKMLKILFLFLFFLYVFGEQQPNPYLCKCTFATASFSQYIYTNVLSHFHIQQEWPSDIQMFYDSDVSFYLFWCCCYNAFIKWARKIETFVLCIQTLSASFIGEYKISGKMENA